MELMATLTRMETHALRRKGSPGTGPLLSFEELDDEESAIISREFRENVKNSAPKTQMEWYRTLHNVLVKYGVMCTHPVELRLYDGFHRARSQLRMDDSRWYRCEMCDCLVINR